MSTNHYHLMTMPHNSVTPHYHGIVVIDDNNYLQTSEYTDIGGIPIEDFGCFYYSETPFDTSEKAMFDKFLSLMDD